MTTFIACTIALALAYAILLWGYRDFPGGRVIALVGVLAAAGGMIFGGGQDYVRLARVVDGDTFVDTKGITYRLAGVDAPEMACNCSKECTLANRATGVLRALLTPSTPIRVVEYGVDRYDRLLVDAFVYGDDVGEMLVEMGLARRWTEEPPVDHPWCGAPV